MLVILFLLLRTSIDIRKYDVFLSPIMIQLALDFIAQISSSIWRIRLYFSDSWFCRLIRKELGQLAIAFWMPCNLAIIFFFLRNTFPKTSLFHLWTFTVKSEIAPASLAFSLTKPLLQLLESPCDAAKWTETWRVHQKHCPYLYIGLMKGGNDLNWLWPNEWHWPLRIVLSNPY